MTAKKPGKQRGYVILPVVIPAGVEPHEALNDNDISRIARTHILDVKKLIHPYEQLRTGFSPDAHTAAVCLQVLRAAIACLVGDRKMEQHA